MKKKPVSIIIPVCNLLYYTRRCIESIFRTTSPSLFELIVVDNGSDISTKEYLKTQAGRITCITNETNLGFARANNQGAAIASGDYLVFLNNDTVPHEMWLSELVKAASSGPDIGIVGNKLLFPNGTVQHCGIAFGPQKYPFQIYRGCPATLPCVNIAREYRAVTAACMLVPKRDFHEVKGFDETYLNGCEDVDLALKLGSLGRRCLYTPLSVVTHYEGRSPNRQGNMEQNYGHFLKKWSAVIQPDASTFFSLDKMTLERTRSGMAYRNVTNNELYCEPEGLFRQAKERLMTGETEKALGFFDELLAKDPCNESALKVLGEFSSTVRNYAAAAGFYGRLLELHPHDQQVERIVLDIQSLMQTQRNNMNFHVH